VKLVPGLHPWKRPPDAPGQPLGFFQGIREAHSNLSHSVALEKKVSRQRLPGEKYWLELNASSQGSRIKDQESRIKNQGSRIKNEGSRIKDQGSRIKDQGSRIKDQGSRIKDQGEQ
jgi:hypothetical protein